MMWNVDYTCNIKPVLHGLLWYAKNKYESLGGISVSILII